MFQHFVAVLFFPLGNFDIKLIFGTGRRCRSLLRLLHGLVYHQVFDGFGICYHVDKCGWVFQCVYCHEIVPFGAPFLILLRDAYGAVTMQRGGAVEPCDMCMCASSGCIVSYKSTYLPFCTARNASPRQRANRRSHHCLRSVTRGSYRLHPICNVVVATRLTAYVDK